MSAEFDLDGFLPYQLAVLASRVSREFASIYKDRFGISTAEWRVLAHLSQSGSVSVREIHRRVDMDKSKVSRAATRLEDAGYISKRPGTHDRRLVELRLTDQGRTLIRDLAPLARQFETEFLGAIPDDAPEFRRILQQLLATGRTTSDGDPAHD